IRRIPSGVPDVALRELPRRSHGPVIGWLGRIEHQKGLDVLVRSMTELPGVTAVLVGDGSERLRLADLARSLGIADRIVFEGWSERPRDYLTTFDLYVQPSRFEAQGVGAV